MQHTLSSKQQETLKSQDILSCNNALQDNDLSSHQIRFILKFKSPKPNTLKIYNFLSVVQNDAWSKKGSV